MRVAKYMYSVFFLLQMIVDMREFRGALPLLLHNRGINIPVTLEVCIIHNTDNVTHRWGSINRLNA